MQSGHRGITKNIFVISLVSFFNDVASEMVYPIVPIFITTVLGAPVTVVGLIEGIAESTASILRVFSGWFSDKLKSRKPFMVVGYGLSTLSKAALAASFHWSMVLGGRFLDRFGKGVRTSARDAFISESSEARYRGSVFGFHRAVDTMGALVGPLIALAILRKFDDNLRLVFYVAIIPAAIGIMLLAVFVKDIRGRQDAEDRFLFRLRDVKLTHDFRIFLIASTIFAIGNSSDAFLILRAHDLGLSLSLTIIAYTVFNFFYAIFSHPAGIISDKIGQKKVLLWGFCVFALVYFLFGIISKPYLLWILFSLYGVHMAFTEGIGKAYISLLVKNEFMGTMYGIYQTLTGLAAFLSSLIAGFLWKYVAHGAPFVFGGIMALLALIIFAASMRRVNRTA